MNWIKNSLSNKVIMAVLATNLIVFLVFGVFTTSKIRKILIQNTKEEIHKEAKIMAHQLDTFFANNSSIVRHMSIDKDLIEILKTVKNKEGKFNHPNFREVVAEFKKIKKKNSKISLVWAGIKASDDLIINDYDWAHDSSYEMEEMNWYQQMDKNRKLTYSKPYIDQVTGELIISIVEPVYKDDELIGNVGIDLMIDQVKDLIANYSLRETGYAVLITNNGDIVYHPNKKKILNQNLTDFDSTVKELVEPMVSGNSDVIEYNLEGTDKYLAFAPILTNGWSIGVVINQQEVLNEVFAFSKLLTIIFIIALSGLIILTAVIINRTLKRVSKLAAKMNDFRDGDFTTAIEVNSNDEIGQLSNTFNQMTTEIAAAYQQLEAYNQEITELNNSLEHQATHDPLTKLPNRRKFEYVLSSELIKERKGAIMLLDLDNFKEVNDTLGHIYGDQLLEKIGERLLELSAEENFVARYGGDEFLILARGSNSISNIERKINKIKDVLADPFLIRSNEIQISFSLGIARYPDDSTTTNQLITQADTAMYQAKVANNQDYLYYNQQMVTKIRRKKEIRNKLKVALKNDGFKLKYQPQVNLDTGKGEYFEALIRLKEYDLSPGQFIPVAEESSLIIDIGRWVTEEAIKQLAILQESEEVEVKISINFSVQQLNDPKYIDFLKETLNKYGVDSYLLEIEITESILIEKEKKAIKFLNQLSDIGVQLALDDFGNGYSSLSNLSFISFDKVKLDKSLIDRFLKGDNIETIISLIQLFHSINLPIVAEGVETKDQYIKLKKNKCDYIQGYLFSKPVSNTKLKSLIEINYIKRF